MGCQGAVGILPGVESTDQARVVGQMGDDTRFNLPVSSRHQLDEAIPRHENVAEVRAVVAA